MGLGRHYYWCPNCSRKGVTYYGYYNKYQGRHFICDYCKAGYTKKEIK